MNKIYIVMVEEHSKFASDNNIIEWSEAYSTYEAARVKATEFREMYPIDRVRVQSFFLNQ